ncbi:MAG: VWA domain-containing protein [Phycisphaerales bacterium]|nr:VWA domain-containing protein [Phycisphaerales bacterium]
MIGSHRVSSLVVAAGLVLGLGAGVVRAQESIDQPLAVTDMLGRGATAPGEATIEVVFVLDTTGSMSGLIEGAKSKIWAIANQIATARPRPTIRMGLVGYRDRGDAYITKATALTEDLDQLYSDLMEYAADGGGDGPESVNQALHEAVTGMAWTPRDDKSGAMTLRLIYLVGDAPPHMDYEQDVRYQASCEEAARRGITVNAIQCGGDAEAMRVWQEVARLGEGEYLAIEQSGGMVAVATPYDKELGELATRLSGTLLAYGSRQDQAELESRRERALKLAEAAEAPAAAGRAAYLGGGAGGATLTGRQELVKDLADGTVKLEEIKGDELPPELAGLSQDEQRALISKKASEREALQAKIGELAARRDEYLKLEMSRLGGESRDAFDTRVLEALRVQAARVGIRYE